MLDCGCGPGTITLGLAEIVDPGEVIGVDIGPSEVERAQSNADALGVSNARFEVANVYELPFDDEPFDAVFSSAMLEHLGEPSRALTEMKRVLKPGGVIGVRDSDWGGVLLWPSDPLVEELISNREKVWMRNGGNSRLGRQLSALLRGAGFGGIRATASYVVFTDFQSDEPTPDGNFGEFMATWASGGEPGRQMLEYGISSEERLREYADACRQWGQNPDAFLGYSNGEAVGWKE